MDRAIPTALDAAGCVLALEKPRSPQGLSSGCGLAGRRRGLARIAPPILRRTLTLGRADARRLQALREPDLRVGRDHAHVPARPGAGRAVALPGELPRL